MDDSRLAISVSYAATWDSRLELVPEESLKSSCLSEFKGKGRREVDTDKAILLTSQVDDEAGTPSHWGNNE